AAGAPRSRRRGGTRPERLDGAQPRGRRRRRGRAGRRRRPARAPAGDGRARGRVHGTDGRKRDDMNLFASELRKLRTVPTPGVISGVGWALVLLSVLLPFIVPGFSDQFTGSASQVAGAIEAIGGNSIIPLVVGVLVITTEFRHGTIGRTLQLVP